MARLSREQVTAYAWIYSEIPDPYDGKPSTYPKFTEEYKQKLLSEFNIGFDQKYTDQVLRFLEYGTHEEPAELIIELKEVPTNTPRYLDDEINYISWPRIAFKELKFSRTSGLSTITPDIENFILEINTTREKMYELFSRVYICNKIQATSYGNLVKLDRIIQDNTESCDLVIWGVIGEEPIYY